MDKYKTSEMGKALKKVFHGDMTVEESIKMAEREIHFEDRGEYPVLLLDDVLSELDAKRQDFILNRISSGQVLITCCEDQSISAKTGGKLITINNGKVLG